MPVTTDGRVYLVDAADDGSTVEAWSTMRLPYEPKGAMEELREAIRRGIKKLAPTPDGVLHALYASPVLDDCDAENIAIYNVGGGSFAGASPRGLRVERSLSCAPAPHPLGREASHHVRYRAVAAAKALEAWKLAETLASWSDVTVPRLNEETKPSAVWAAVRTADVRVERPALSGEPFGLVLRVGVPHGERPAPAKLVKPLADGVIAALHVYDGSAVADVAHRANMQVPFLSEREIEGLLTESDAGVLGRRRFVWPRAQGLQWSPADHLCWALVLDIEAADRWRVSGEATTLAPAR